MKDDTSDQRREAFSIREASRQIGISERHLRQLCKDGRVRAVALGRRKVVPKQEIERLLAGA